MSWKNFCLLLDPVCFKRHYSRKEYKRITIRCKRVNSTDLYKIYKLYGDMPYTEFYTMLRQHFYFDKYECKHGVEYFYYIKFKELELEEHLPTDIIKIHKAR